MKIRAEHQHILLLEDSNLMGISESNFAELYNALDGENNKIRQKLNELNFEFSEYNTEKVRNATRKSIIMPESPSNAFSYPLKLNFELTTKCPLNCPQCYCSLENGKELDFDRAVEVLEDGAENGLWEVNFSGGETILYSQIYAIIKKCTELGMSSNVALSGYGINKESLSRLIDAGASCIFVSLNGSTEEINSHTRNGYRLAINTLELLSSAKFPKTVVNFVAHNSNCEDFPNMIDLCEQYNVNQLVVIAAKPTSKYEMNTIPNAEQTVKLAENIKKTQSQSKVNIGVENCYSSLRAYMGKSFFAGNTNTGITRGCFAGRTMISLNVDGDFTPCRHLLFAEKFKTIEEYWYKSEVLNKLRNIEETSDEPCSNCKLSQYCLSCLAVNYKTEGKLIKRNKYCAIPELEKRS